MTVCSHVSRATASRSARCGWGEKAEPGPK